MFKCYLFCQQILSLLKAQGSFIYFWWCTGWGRFSWGCWLLFWSGLPLRGRLPLWCWFSWWGADLFWRLPFNRRHYFSRRWGFEAIRDSGDINTWRLWSNRTWRLAGRACVGERIFAWSRGRALGVDHSFVYPGGGRVDGDLAFSLEAWPPILTSPTSLLNICGFYSGRFLQFSQLGS